jgi:ElaB/YqjD/DUF883 family membrane-anchored ribosome-binding protein
MTTPAPNPEPGPTADVEELRADIEQTREQLGETVSALTDKLDVKARVEQKAHDVGASARANPAVPVGIVVAVAVAIGALVWWRRR